MSEKHPFARFDNQKDLLMIINSFYTRIIRLIGEKLALDESVHKEWKQLSVSWNNFIDKHPNFQEKNLPPAFGCAGIPPDQQKIRSIWAQIHYLRKIFS
jgi:hypothetical protein